MKSLAINNWFDLLDRVAGSSSMLPELKSGIFGEPIAVDASKEGDDIVVRADVPGVPKENLNISLENGVLTISGERSECSEKTCGNVYFQERSLGSFSRSIKVPANVDERSVKATLQDGVLQLILKRSEPVAAKKIEIS